MDAFQYWVKNNLQKLGLKEWIYVRWIKFGISKKRL
jgi:hypothetical protein